MRLLILVIIILFLLWVLSLSFAEKIGRFTYEKIIKPIKDSFENDK